MTMTAASAGVVAIGGGAYSAVAVAQDGGAPVRGGSVKGAVVGPITSLDPFSSLLGSGDGMAYHALYNTLIEVTLNGDLAPELATEWSISEDGLTYTFTLVEGVMFHDGTALDAESVKWNLERYMAEGSTHANADRLRVISSIEAADAATLVVALSVPNAPFLATVSGCPIVSPAAVESLGEDFQLQGVGSGPFTFVSWEPGSTAVFARNENYWEIAPDGEPFPYLDEFIIDGVPDDSVRLLNLRSGEFQLNERLNPRDASTIAADANIEVVETSLATSYLVAMNVTKAPFDNPALRTAVLSALDRAALIENISFGTGYASSFAFPKDAWFFVEDPAPVFDVEAARASLAEAGYPDGIDITLTIINRPMDSQIAQIVKAQLETVGIRTAIEVLERTTWVDLWTAREGEMGILQRGAGTIDPDDQSSFFSPTNVANFAGYDSPEILALIDQSNQVVDQAERLALWEQVVAILVEDAVYVFLGCVPAPGAKRVEVQDLDIVHSITWKLHDTWIG
jgi:peptide/nickel transport system substrate-binding protein